MKKLLSILLVVLMIVSSVPFVYAEESNTYKVGDIIQFGSYPQSKVTDSATITALNNKAPAWDNWTSYGYYTGTGDYGTMTQGDWMRYTDIMYNGNKYRGVKFTQYRPDFTCNQSSSTCAQYDNGYSTNTVYWFKFEPIDWRVLDPATGLVMCETIIDSQPYSNKIYYNSDVGEYFNDASYKNYASDYETSSIRQWLNNDFYNTAFTDSEKKEINTTTLNNDGYYTSVGTTGYEKLDSNSTNDKIFLLSYNEVRNSNFGFSSDYRYYDKARQAQGSDYAKSQGLYVNRSSGSTYNNNSHWLLRSPGHYSYYCCSVYYYGSSYYYDVLSSYNGVRPALRFNRISDIGQSEHQHSYTSEITTEATHTTVGVKTYTCECGDTYTEEIAKTEGHSYTSAVTKEPTHLEEGETTYTCECGDSYTEVIAKLTGHTYEKAVTAPTCTAQGYTTYTCECGDSYVDDYTDKLDHEYASEITTPATHLTEGIETFTCECGDSYTEVIEKIAKHNYKEDVTEPTCTAKGYTTYTCECGDIYVADYTDSKGHSYSAMTTQPTCTQNGLVTTFCSSCGDTYTETLEPTGHSFAEGSSKCENCDFDKADDCSCNCHKGGISGFFFKLILFFQKIFKTNKTCACGIAHY